MKIKKQAYTLIETIIVVLVLSILSLGIGSFITRGIDVWAFYKDTNSAQARARHAMNEIVRELKRIRSVDSVIYRNSYSIYYYVDSPEGIPQADQNILGITTSMEEQGNTLYRLDYFAYKGPSSYSGDFKEANKFLPPDAISHYLNGSPMVKFELVPRVSLLRFQYFKKDAGGAFIDCDTDDWNTDLFDNERLIKVILSVQEGDKTFTMASIVRIRNNL